MPACSIILVAADRPRRLLATLLALRQHVWTDEIVVVQNVPISSLAEVIKLARLPIRLLRLPRPTSLAAAFNAGLAATTAPFCLLLHNDVLLTSDPAPVVAMMELDATLGVVAAKLLSPEVPRHVLNAGYTAAQGRLYPLARGGGRPEQDVIPRDVAAASDACMLLRRTHLRFDERFWFGLEDVDLCFRYQQLGLRVLFHPALEGIHLQAGGASVRLNEPIWAARHIANQRLYHSRWCSAMPLREHPLQDEVCGEDALAYLYAVDAAIGPIPPDSPFAVPKDQR